MGKNQVSVREIEHITFKAQAHLKRFGLGSSVSETHESRLRSEASTPSNPRPTRRTATQTADTRSTRASSKKSKTASSRDEDESPEPGCRRVTRHQGRPPLAYNARYHPADEVLRPFQAARMRAESNVASYLQGEDTSDGNESDAVGDIHGESSISLGEDDDEDVRAPQKLEKSSLQPLDPDRRRSSRNLSRAEKPNYDMKFHPTYDQSLRPSTVKAAMIRKSIEYKPPRSSIQTETTSSPSADESATDVASTLLEDESTTGRVDPISKAESREKDDVNWAFSTFQCIVIPLLIAIPLLYQQNLNPSSASPILEKNTPPQPLSLADINASTAPSSSKKVRLAVDDVFYSEFCADVSPQTTALGPLADATPSPTTKLTTLLALSEVATRYPTGRVLDFNQLSSPERYLYVLQKGAPLNTDTIPKTWSDVKRDLFNHGYITQDELSDEGGTQSIKHCYERIRLGVEAFFNSKPEAADKRDWTVRYIEDFDAFDKKPGSKYWKHHQESIVQPTSIKADPIELLEDTEPKDDVCSDSESTTNEESGTRSENRDIIMTTQGKGLTVEPVEPVDRMHDDEFNQLLSSPDQFSTADEGLKESPTDFFLDDRTSSKSSDQHPYICGFCPINGPAEDIPTASTQVSPPPELFQAFACHDGAPELANNYVDPRKIQHRGSTSPLMPKTKRRKTRTSPEIIVHEDSPRRVTTMGIPESPGTDIPKENFDVADAFLSDLGVPNMRIPRSRSRVVNGSSASPRSARRRSTNMTPSWGLTPIGSRRSPFVHT